MPWAVRNDDGVLEIHGEYPYLDESGNFWSEGDAFYWSFDFGPDPLMELKVGDEPIEVEILIQGRKIREFHRDSGQ